MAVYTIIENQDINYLFQQFGGIESMRGITEGVENTNYLINCNNNKKYILTIFEKRTKASDIPFFHRAMKEFSLNGINCPTPIIVNEKDIFKAKEKPCAIYSFVNGTKITSLNDQVIISLSKSISKIHHIGIESRLYRENNMLKPTWKYILGKFKDYKGKSYDELNYVFNIIKILENKFPKNLKSALVHGDLFKDNIFFENDEVSGFIDFFFTCSDTIVYDLATLINAWFFNLNGFDEHHFQIFYNHYFDSISWTNEEKENLNFYLKASAIRFFLTRMHDQYFNKDGEVNHKDPLEFFKILQFHEKNNLQDYFD
ncbi:homoserine kinase [Alphaproteobacteria bacterium]|nr:homoserine kinase [Alphaproteobacteria bacterium]MDB3974247.1 homoserine kinase [Alphaproteobacteria bacterium]